MRPVILVISGLIVRESYFPYHSVWALRGVVSMIYIYKQRQVHLHENGADFGEGTKVHTSARSHASVRAARLLMSGHGLFHRLSGEIRLLPAIDERI